MTGLAAPLLTESTYWYLTRASGFVSLVLLSVAFALGLLTAGRVWSPRWPRFVTESLHRSMSLTAVGLVFVHVLAILLDDYVKIDPIDAVVPFVSSYLPFWLGLGAIAFDVLLALIITSLLRTRLSRAAWRAVHWLAYLCWPVALAHTIGIGTDRLWVLGVVALSVFMVIAAGVYRVAGWRRVAVRRPI
ncbi:MAG TPA: ferric reductase-like transmembrane domain-containing protein [Actinophytocola sp.]|uniref:ferric reductase-like transmembrane domain-containing protein n=1 Tax=Actinophytocola sp. TaxID=1872138 RepID=UPI002DBC5351|nr:ferric reductase-like transmembrane domain-containing protein [Actinophytocola sp.]HEU5473152.1 ferric reductase-like transmembrane domain-containing protein [Actinophytocola sp.]